MRDWLIGATVLVVLGALAAPAAAESGARRFVFEWIVDRFALGVTAQQHGGDLDVGQGAGLSMEVGLPVVRRVSGLDALETGLGFRGVFVSNPQTIEIDGEPIDGSLGLAELYLAARYRVRVGRVFVFPAAGVLLSALRDRDGEVSTGLQPGWLLGAGLDVPLGQRSNPARTFHLAMNVRGEVAFEALYYEPRAPTGYAAVGGIYFVARWWFVDEFGGLKEAF